ncbi:MAG: hypothetical protein GXP54_00555, partial [Deltaproteobacteria bacterium]|nr:hypothetical protein [Deltaproteobacteria bacterium]
ETKLPEATVLLTCSPAILEQLTFEGLLAAIEASEPGHTVWLSLDCTGSEPNIMIASDAPAGLIEGTSAINKARSLAVDMGATIEISAAEAGGSVIRIGLVPGRAPK